MRKTTQSAIGVLGTICAAALLAPAAGAGRIDTGLIEYPNYAFEGSQANTGFARVRGAGGTYVKLFLNWNRVAPRRPADPTDPYDPAYDWAWFDEKIRDATQHNLQPLVMVAHAPPWASAGDGWTRPDPFEFGYFARAAATRYSGSFDPSPSPEFPYYDEFLPRIRYWQAWNEPNLAFYFPPQYEGGRLTSPERYRTLVNRFSNAVKAVNPTNMVLAGGTGPFKRVQNSAPLAFMREFLCLRSNLTPQAGCGPARFDIWGHHPYTSGDPRHTAVQRDDVSLGDMPEMRRVLRAGARHGKIDSAGSVKFWVDEFSWDSKPPDPGAIPAALHARWTAEALYRMWGWGVSNVMWLQLMDNRYTGRCGDPYQSGLYHYSSNIANARAKLALSAYRFPLVAFPRRGRVFVWGRTPNSVRATVVVERRGTRGSWRRVGTLRANAYGIFQKTYRLPTSRYVRARLGSRRSVAFSLRSVPDRFYNPFGQRPLPGQCPARATIRATP